MLMLVGSPGWPGSSHECDEQVFAQALIIFPSCCSLHVAKCYHEASFKQSNPLQ